jgi:mono-ADP-ribosyltransferase sirtuin 6
MSEEQADIDRVLKERGKGARKQYLCSWMDGAEPQWVAAKHLEGSVALEEWEEAEDPQPEIFDEPPQVETKCEQLVQWLRAAKRPAVLCGAGLSSSILPTFRGAGGLWTTQAGSAKKVQSGRLMPTLAHRALVALEQAGFVNFCATQNYDDLASVSGFPAAKLAELHGNIFTESCRKCGTVYHRDFEVELATSKAHETGRMCEDPGCSQPLYDSIVHFGESLPWRDLCMANAKFTSADLTIVLGSSLLVTPACDLPFKSKRRVRKDTSGFVSPSPQQSPKAVIVNLQQTRCDKLADLIIRAKCDEVLDRVASALVPGWVPGFGLSAPSVSSVSAASSSNSSASTATASAKRKSVTPTFNAPAKRPKASSSKESK